MQYIIHKHLTLLNGKKGWGEGKKKETCCPLIVATGIAEACGMLLSIVTVTCPGTLVGADSVEGGAGAIGRLGMVGFRGG